MTFKHKRNTFFVNMTYVEIAIRQSIWSLYTP